MFQFINLCFSIDYYVAFDLHIRPICTGTLNNSLQIGCPICNKEYNERCHRE